VDDASTDLTAKVIAGFDDKRIRYFKHYANKGPSASRNSGIRVARGDYIAFLDDDDEYLPEKLEKQLRKFKEINSKKLGVVFCGIVNLCESNVLYTRLPQKMDLKRALSPSSIGWQVTTALIRKECFFRTGFFDEMLKQREDWDMVIRLSRDYEFHYVQGVLYKRYIHGHQSMTNIDERISSREAIIRKYMNDFMKYPCALSWQYRLLGSLYCVNNNVLEARRYFSRSIKTWPFNVGSYVHIILSLLSHKLHRKILENMALKKVGEHLLYY